MEVKISIPTTEPDMPPRKQRRPAKPRDVILKVIKDEVKKRTRTSKKELGPPVVYSRLLRERYPSIYAEIDFGNNPGINLGQLTYASNRHINWICPDAKCDHHHYGMKVCARTNLKYPSSCPFCNGHKTCRCDSFLTLFPRLEAEIDWDVITEDPWTLPPGSNKLLPWKCLTKTCGHHKYTATVANRTMIQQPTGCPFCSHRNTCVCDSVYTSHPQLLQEIDYDLLTEDLKVICPGSNKVFDWKCPEEKCGHKWKAMMWVRTAGAGCPLCSSTHMENICFMHLKFINEPFTPQKSFEECRLIYKLPFDCYLDRLNAVIEVDGIQHFQVTHFYGSATPTDLVKQRESDATKMEYCRKNGIHILRISYSELSRIPVHIDAFLKLIKESTGHIERRIGEEYVVKD